VQKWLASIVAAGCALTSANAVQATHGISAAWIQATNPPGDDSVTTSSIYYSMNDFRLLSASKGTIQVQIGASKTDDAANGIILTCPAVNVTTNYGTNNYGICMFETNSDGSYHLGTFFTGENGTSVKINYDFASAYFPYSKFIGGHIRSDPYGNGFTNNLLTGSPGLVWGTHVTDLKLTQNINATIQVDLRPFGYVSTNIGNPSMTEGIILVNHGKDRAGDGNYAVSAAQADGTWRVLVRNHNGNAEQDPMGFVFIPKTNTSVIIGKFKGTDPDGNIVLMHSGNALPFAIQNVSGGRWDLKIPGYGPTNGILVISGAGGGSQNADNEFSYKPYADGSGWEIQSRDLPGGGFQTPGSGNDTIADFVFIPGPTRGVTVTPTKNLLTTEAGATANFTMVLDTKPTANVTINLSSSNTGEGTVSPSSVTFTPANWETPQVVTVTGVDDAVQDGSQFYTIVTSAATSADPVYNGFNPSDVSVVNLDNEAGISVTKNSVTTTEAGGTDTFDVFLSTPPTGDVTINVSSSNTAEGTVSPSSLTFNNGNYNIPQTVTVTGVDDAVDDGDQAYTIITSAATSTDPIYNGFNPTDVSAINVDNDTVGLTFSASSLTVFEPSTATNFTVVLNSQPTANVTVNLASSDTTEGTVSPASRTFTTANWSTPQSFTLTAADDNVSDGNVGYSLNATVTSSDTLYAAVTGSVSATTIDNEAGITLPGGTVYYGVGDSGVGVDGTATVSDASHANYSGGSLTLALTANASTDDRLEIRNDGTAANQVSVAGNTVSYGGTAIGTFTGGSGATPLVLSLNASSSPDAVQGVIRAATFRSVNTSNPPPATRTLTVTLANGVGGSSSASKSIVISLVHVADFQDGVDHGGGVYTEETDIELNSLQPDVNYPAGFDPVNGLQVQADNSQILMRFSNIVGTAVGKIPPGAIVVSADLTLNCSISGLGSPLMRMLQPFDGQNDTWNSWGFAVQQDNIESSTETNAQFGTFPTSGATTVGNITVSVLPDVQAWVNGTNNYGWVLPGYTTKTVFTPSESTNVANRPRLTVKWVPAGTSMASFRQGVNGYTGTKDVSVRQGDPNGVHGADTSMFCDGEVTAPLNDPQEPLIQFQNIFGSNPGQVPSGATIQAAMLDIGSLVGDAMGDGGHVHAMLAPWTDTDNWNTLVNGIQTDGVEALVTPTFTAGNPGLTPDVQGGNLEFDVTSDVQAWAAGSRPNYGWAFIPWTGGGNGWGFASSENVNIGWRPQLRIYYTASAASTPIHITSINRGPTSVTLNFTGAASTGFLVWRATSVNGPYTNIGPATSNVSGVGSFTDNAPPAGAAFYKVSGP